MIATMLTCSLSGQTPPPDPVVTPSGRICSRRLLLIKLTENGGRDPFDAAANPRILDESDLVDLVLGGDGQVVPPRLPSATSFPSLMGQIQGEYDGILLELFDTRRALEETRRELSQALYQNDAAVRVVARLAAERDAARETVRELSSSAAPQPPPVASVVEDDADGRKRRRVDGEAAEEEEVGPAPPGPAVVEPDAGGAAAPSKIPEEDLAVMVDAWKVLSKKRRKSSKEKKTDAKVVKLDDISGYVETDKKSLHKSSSKPGVLCLGVSRGGNIVVSGGRDKQAIVYDRTERRVVASLLGAKGEISALDIHSTEDTVVTGSTDGRVRLYKGAEFSQVAGGGVVVDSEGGGAGEPSPIVAISVQPTGKYALAASKSGKIAFLSLSDDKISISASFGDIDNEGGGGYTCGGVHPDGLIYGVGTSDGKLKIWDLKSQSLAGTLEVSCDIVLLQLGHQ